MCERCCLLLAGQRDKLFFSCKRLLKLTRLGHQYSPLSFLNVNGALTVPNFTFSRGFPRSRCDWCQWRRHLCWSFFGWCWGHTSRKGPSSGLPRGWFHALLLLIKHDLSWLMFTVGKRFWRPEDVFCVFWVGNIRMLERTGTLISQ